MPANAQELTKALGGKWHGHYGCAPCPVCQPERRRDQAALTLADGRSGLLLDCKKSGCRFRDILAAAGIAPGTFAAPDPAKAAQRAAIERAEDARRSGQARLVWDGTQPIHGSPAETYLRGRGITCSLPDTLRFHPATWHGPTARLQPAMVASVGGAGGFAVHRTFLRPDGSGKAGLPGGDKLMLGPTGGGAVRLTAGLGRLVVCEGIETGLSLASGLLRAPAAVLAALSTSGMSGFNLPNKPDGITIATDGDSAGKKAGHALADRAHRLGWNVSLLPAPDGRDWADVLALKGVAA